MSNACDQVWWHCSLLIIKNFSFILVTNSQRKPWKHLWKKSNIDIKVQKNDDRWDRNLWSYCIQFTELNDKVGLIIISKKLERKTKYRKMAVVNYLLCNEIAWFKINRLIFNYGNLCTCSDSQNTHLQLFLQSFLFKIELIVDVLTWTVLLYS